MLLKVSQFLVLFFYVYSIQFVGLPFGIGTRIVLAGLGLGLLFLDIRKNLQFNKDFLPLVFILLCLSLFSLFSTLVNYTNDYQFIDYSISMLLIFLASYFTFNFFLVKKEVSKESYLKVVSEGIISVVLVQSIIAFTMFFYSPLADLLNSVQVFIDLDVGKLEESLDLRLVGFGIKFFAFGIVNGFALIIIASILKHEYYSPFIRTFLWLSYLFIFFIGMMAARTTVIGFGLSLLLYYNPFEKRVQYNFRNRCKLVMYFLLMIIVIFLVKMSLSDSMDRIDNLFEFGFDLFFNYFETGNAKSESLNQLNDMYIWPTELTTYLIGDGRFMGNGFEYYYKGTDVGWIRLLYYFGIPGTLIYFLTHYYIIKKQIRIFPIYKNTFWVVLIYFIILNFKGFSDVIFLIIPFMFTVVNKNMKYEI